MKKFRQHSREKNKSSNLNIKKNLTHEINIHDNFQSNHNTNYEQSCRDTDKQMDYHMKMFYKSKRERKTKPSHNTKSVCSDNDSKNMIKNKIFLDTNYDIKKDLINEFKFPLSEEFFK